MLVGSQVATEAAPSGYVLLAACRGGQAAEAGALLDAADAALADHPERWSRLKELVDVVDGEGGTPLLYAVQRVSEGQTLPHAVASARQRAWPVLPALLNPSRLPLLPGD